MNPLQTLLPGVAALAVCALLLRRTRVLVWVAAAVMWMQVGVAACACVPALQGAPTVAWAGFCLDSMAALFLLLTTVVVAASLTHGIVYFRRERRKEAPPQRNHVQQFYLFTAGFLVAMYGVVTADNLGYLWISMEATTLLSAPLVYYHRSRVSLEATWKYLIICSVAIAFAFLGTAVLYAASQKLADLPQGTLLLSQLSTHAVALPRGMLRLAFVFILLGYGTKAGLFPLHNWLPDAHSQAPPPASAMLSGALLNCALVALWRVCGMMRAAGDGAFVEATLLPMAAVTALTAAMFLLKQQDFKRLWAYSSMENVGLMAVAVALGCNPGFGLLAANHSLIKVALFLLAGNLLQQFGTKRMDDLRGLLSLQPLATVLMFAAAVAVAGTPPFGSFLAEWRILYEAADSGHVATVLVMVTALAIAFIALCTQVAGMAFGETATPPPGRHAERIWPRSAVASLAVPAVLVGACLWLGVAFPPAWTVWLEALGR